MDPTASPVRFFNRGPSPATRLVFFAALSLSLLFVDARYQYLESVRSALSTLLYPLQRVAALPVDAWRAADDFFTLHNNLVRDNNVLRQQHTVDAEQLLQYQSLKADDDHLRELLAVRQRANYPTLLAEIAYVERDVFQRKLYLDKGAQAGVLAGQVVMDDSGVVGQVTRVYPLVSEVTLITDKDHAVPVMVLRNGLRTVVFGSGDTTDLVLRYVPNSADIQQGDVLVTSGIDGVYPPGLPVAKVARIENNPAFPFARINCLPVAGVNRQRQLLILTGAPSLPERPAEPAAAGAPAKKPGNRNRQNQP
ncbi:MAG: rod shape-determining protein MreC [Gallionellaceae bacterium]|nr:rod shape-determining protein MreC [Gallionellaceae bacterium]